MREDERQKSEREYRRHLLYFPLEERANKKKI